MPERATSLTAAAGEHFVAYRLSALGYPVALTRGGSPTIDLMVGDLSGRSAISVQVKTSNWASRPKKRKPENSHSEWDVGRKALALRGESIFYAFVDLKWDWSKPSTPDVFIVPSTVVADFLGPDWSRYMFWIRETDRAKWFEAWHLITDRLSAVLQPK
jgi:hypothetical protein